jgi:hypothetical protein
MLGPAFFCAAGSAVSMAALIYSTTIFDGVKIGTGPEEYAEKTWPFMPWYCAMPLNTLVNIVYTIVGFYWLFQRRQQSSTNIYSNVFAWMAIIYSGIQFFRIATQQHIFGVLDQWYTLHMASWVFIWALRLQGNDDTWLLQKLVLSHILLCLSYPTLTLIHSWGFEIALVIHLVLIFVTIIRLHLYSQKNDDASFRLNLIFKGTLCCTGFVLFDLFEIYLASVFPSVFTICSGHFLSRMCDALQIYFVIALLTTIEDYKCKEPVKKDD